MLYRTIRRYMLCQLICFRTQNRGYIEPLVMNHFIAMSKIKNETSPCFNFSEI